MQRLTGTLTIPGLVGLAAVAAAALGGCVASGEDGSMLVLKSVAPPSTATGGVCMYMSLETEGELSRGALDVSGGIGYQFVAQVASRITANPGQETARTILFRGANVDLTFPDAGALGAQIADLQSKGLLHFMASFSGELPPNGLVDKPFELIPAGVAAELNTAAGLPPTVVQATFTVVGDLGGGNVSSQPFHYSVTLGKGNLITDLGLCSTVSKSSMLHTGNACAPGQDFPIDCCTDDKTGVQKCPAVGTAP